jgi:two-component system chemotaxis response regulator CheB
MTTVLVVDDSQFMRTVIGNILADHGYEVRSASNGERAVEAVGEYGPDIVTMDVEMPGMNGIQATERIMATHPTPILMLSAHTETGADATLKALSRGAVDFLAKPGGEVSMDMSGLEDRLVRKIETVSRADLTSVTPASGAAVSSTADGGAGAVSTSGSPAGTVGTESPTAAPRPDAYVDDPTVVIGASTGGPKILEEVLSSLPLDMDARVLVVQHMPASFTDRLAERLDSILAFEVSEAAHGDRLEGGEIAVAKGGYHMHVAHYANGRLRITLGKGERVHGVRPSIDVTMQTAAERVTDPLVGVALTGMGSDGAAGIDAIKQAGGRTIAQDRETSPVFGIPRQAIQTGSVDAVLPADGVADGICRALAADRPQMEADTDG